MGKVSKYFCVVCYVFVITKAVFAASCATGYGVMAHDIDLDFNINTQLPDAVTATTKALNANTFTLSDDGNCYSGYEPFARTDGVIYPLVEDSDLCADGYYRANGTCTAYTSGGCPTGRYNSAVNNATFVGSEDGSCYSGFDSYTRTDDYIYPLVESSILCPAGQYMANGTCTSYGAGTCPENMRNTTLNTATWATMTNGACPSNYVAETISAIEFACDSYDSQITSETPACLLMCTNGNIFTEVGSCASLCVGHHKLKTGNGLEFPMYATKQITPSINIGIGNNTCYVNLVPGRTTGAIHVIYNDTIYHTVK